MKLFLTYFKRNNLTGEVYAGRASGKYTGDERRDAAQIMKKRDSSHLMNNKGYNAGEIEETSANGDAIRGREQMLIEKLRKDGISGNERNGISPRNKKRNKYLQAALKLFGTISVVLYFLYLCNIG